MQKHLFIGLGPDVDAVKKIWALNERYIRYYGMHVPTVIYQCFKFLMPNIMIKFKPPGGHHGSVVSAAPTNLQSWVRIPVTPPTLFRIWNYNRKRNEKRTKINEKEARIGPRLKKFKPLLCLFSSTSSKLLSETIENDFAKKIKEREKPFYIKQFSCFGWRQFSLSSLTTWHCKYRHLGR